MFRKFIIALIFFINLTSCSGYKYLEFYKNETTEIKYKGACCGCKIVIANQFIGKFIKEQFVFETKCGLFNPTKHYFETDVKGNVTSIVSYVITTDNDYEIPTSDTDKKIFIVLDSIYQSNRSANKREISYLEIKGFKKGEKVHFPVDIQ